jgi:hypothetical protein
VLCCICDNPIAQPEDSYLMNEAVLARVELLQRTEKCDEPEEANLNVMVYVMSMIK